MKAVVLTCNEVYIIWLMEVHNDKYDYEIELLILKILLLMILDYAF